VVTRLKNHPVFVPAIVALFTGLRRGEVLALRWSAVDLERKTLQVREALEQTVVYGLTFKQPKTKAGQREVTLPDVVVNVLREHYRHQLEQRVAFGLGKPTADLLLFGQLDGSPSSPRALTQSWARAAAAIGIRATFHALRHTHISHLIDSGIDVVRISRRVGHANVKVTLGTYAHLFDTREDRCAEAINQAVARLLEG
jgi:integrase